METCCKTDDNCRWESTLAVAAVPEVRKSLCRTALPQKLQHVSIYSMAVYGARRD